MEFFVAKSYQLLIKYVSITQMQTMTSRTKWKVRPFLAEVLFHNTMILRNNCVFISSWSRQNWDPIHIVTKPICYVVILGPRMTEANKARTAVIAAILIELALPLGLLPCPLPLPLPSIEISSEVNFTQNIVISCRRRKLKRQEASILKNLDNSCNHLHFLTSCLRWDCPPVSQLYTSWGHKTRQQAT